ncbi:MAG: alkaline phosphatase family protein [Acidobacteria bacterium]|nr:alkaline phosphatase family protein [Acidobacteriota bacterium]
MLKFVALQDHASHVATTVALEEQGIPDLLMVYFSGVDAAEHQYWAYYQPDEFSQRPSAEDVAALGHVVPGYYRYIDAIVGDLLKRLPKDALVVVLSDHGQGPNPNYRPEVTISEYGKWVSGTHGEAPPGILLFSGPGVKPGRVGHTTVFDIAPTLLALLGIPPTQDMPGRVVTEAFVPEVRESLPTDRVARTFMPMEFAPPTPAAADPDLLEKLRSLGYIR